MTTVQPIERLPSGVPGLDLVLHGGFPKGGIHIIQGAPGTGKTTLGNQLCYHHAVSGGRAVYVTLLAEAHSRMLLHLGTMSFFDPDRLPDQLSYISGLNALDQGGLSELVALLRREIAARRASVLVLDSLVAAEERASSATEFKRFVQELQMQTDMLGCTTFLLTTAKGEAIPPEHTMVDSVIELTDVRYGSRTERGLFVNKLRGSGFLAGRHPFLITEDGLHVYPRLEACFHHSSRPDEVVPGKISTGIPGLDAMLLGGLPQASITGLVGPTGIGKTTLGLHFLCAAPPDESGLLVGFYETPARLQLKAASLGMALKARVDRHAIEILWHPQGEAIQDAIAHQLLELVERRRVRRLFLDGLGAVQEASVEKERISRFFAVLVNELRVRGVTTVYTMETRDVVGPGVRVPIRGVSSLVENLLALRYLEYHARSRRLLSVLKMRNSGYDPALREFGIVDGRGIEMLGAFEDIDELLTGFGRDRTSGSGTP